jgi:hypothetical protein
MLPKKHVVLSLIEQRLICCKPFAYADQVNRVLTEEVTNDGGINWSPSCGCPKRALCSIGLNKGYTMSITSI